MMLYPTLFTSGPSTSNNNNSTLQYEDLMYVLCSPLVSSMPKDLSSSSRSSRTYFLRTGLCVTLQVCLRVFFVHWAGLGFLANC